jgi:hypothetical protein
MFRVLATELLFDFRVGFFPEGREILGYLNWSVIRRQDLDDDKDTSIANAQRSLNPVQILYASGKDGRLPFSVLKFIATTIGELEAFWCEAIKLFLLQLREPGSDDSPYWPVLYVFVAQRTMTNLLDQVKTRFLIDGRQLQFGEPNGETVGAGDPLVDIVCPIRQGTTTLNNLFCENFGSLLCRRRLDLRALKNEIPKNQVAPSLDPPHG